MLALQGGDDLAVNMKPWTRIVNDLSSGSGVATGEYAAVTYQFDPNISAVASRVVLSSNPPPTGPVWHRIGMVTAVGTGDFTLENTNGVSFTVDLLPTTPLRWIRIGMAGTAVVNVPPIAVGDFADAAVRSAGSMYDAVRVMAGVNGNVLSLRLRNGGSLGVTVLPSAITTLNGGLATVSQLATGDHVRLQAVHFVGAYSATTVVAVS